MLTPLSCVGLPGSESREVRRHEHADRGRPHGPERAGPGDDSGAESFPVTIRVDAGRTRGALAPIWRFFGADEPNYATMKDGRKLLGELGELAPQRRLLPRPQPPDHRRRHARPQVGHHQRLHRGRRGRPDLRLDDRRPHLRHLPRARRAALRRDRLHAQGAVDEARAVPARVEAGPALRRHLHRLGLSAEGLRQVGRARLPVGEALRREVRPRPRSRPGTGRSGTSPTSATGRARPRSSASSTTTPSTPCAARLPTARVGGPDMAGTGGDSRATSSSTACAAPTTPPAGRARRSTSSPSTPRAAPSTWTATCAWASPTSSPRSTRASRIDRVVPGAEADADRHRRVRPRGLRRLPGAAARPIATARCTRATPRRASPASTTWPRSTA